MSEGWHDEEADSEYETISRQLRRRMAETSEEMAAAEPGTDAFLTAYNESQRLRMMYRQVRDTWAVPDELRGDAPDDSEDLPA